MLNGSRYSDTVSDLPSLLTADARSSLITDLRAIVGARSTPRAAEIGRHSHSESWHPPGEPDAVVFPLTTDEISAVVRAAARVGAPGVPFGAGSSLEGHVNAVSGGVSID